MCRNQIQNQTKLEDVIAPLPQKLIHAFTRNSDMNLSGFYCRCALIVFLVFWLAFTIFYVLMMHGNNGELTEAENERILYRERHPWQ
ncbi:unnamed protein product [Bursaphelenchus okinawaensis]|uniref:Uncharacterized protein n=1 Tax=Bursaphelenchus okinawaensis TaxID=465554 RepID=A0A811KZA4_9BILA|nr:unnamed protein product [Bursaphelenchus okinawaensis]CAG9113364.1 unnamed protein product [Bursaphelenchus okinawaensis]